MSNKILFLSGLLMTVLLMYAQAQPQRIVTGTITDAETGEPVQSAAVFISGTTVGTTTGRDGKYELKLPGLGSYDVVISHVGYEPVFHKIIADRALSILNVVLKTSEIEEIAITAKAKKVAPREQDIRLFWSTLLGKSPTKNLYPRTKNKNISFLYNSETNILKVSSHEPIEIVNLETGYRINYTLLHFEHDFNIGQSFWKGMYMFTELKTLSRKRKNEWIANRISVYNSSKTRFIRSLYNGTLWEDGFMLYYQGSYIEEFGERKILPYYLDTDNDVNPFFENSDVLFTNGNGKFLYIPTDTALMLICFGRQITREDKNLIKEAENSHLQSFHERDVCRHWRNVGLFRNYISTVDPIQIFSDGTYSDAIHMRTCYSRISGLNMYLPLEYGLRNETVLNKNSTIDDVSFEDVMTSVYDMDGMMLEHSPEKIYLSTDRSMYAAGDTVWISTWVLNAATLEPTDKSRMLHVELIRPDGTILRHLILETLNGMAFGQIVLPTSIIGDALFRLRAYTRWSLNFDESYRFERQIPIMQFRDDVWQGPTITEREGFEWVQRANGSWIWIRKSDSPENVDNNEQQNEILPPLDLQFLPESGRWITGLPSRMAFKAIAEDGLGVNIEGEIFNDLNEKVADFQSMHNGMGTVFLAPQPGRSYHAHLFSGHTVDLPPPDTTGIVMTIQHSNNDTITLQLYFSLDIIQRGEPFYLAVCSRGAHIDAFEVTPLRTRMTMQLLTDDFQTGIARFTLLTKDGIPCNERLVFVDKDDKIKLQFSSSKESNAINLKLQANDAFGNPLH